MSDAPPSPALKKKESWLGVLFTAALCGVFLWWWFQPPPITAETERDPLYWVGLARKNLGRTEPTLGMRLEIVMIAEGLRGHGQNDAADKIEADWLPPTWRTPSGVDGAAALTETEAPPAAAPPGGAGAPAAFAPLMAQLAAAAAAFDTLEIEHGQTVLREAAEAAAAMADPPRTEALWLVAARQARSGLGADAAVTLQKMPTPAGEIDFPEWLVTELFDGDLIAPVVAGRSRRSADDPQVIALATRWRTLVRERLIHRDHPLLTRHGPATNASQPPEEATTPTLWAAVEANRLGEAARLATNDPAAQLAVARLLTWLAAPPPTEEPVAASPAAD